MKLLKTFAPYYDWRTPVVIPPAILAFIVTTSWIVSLTYAFVGGSHGKTEARLIHPACLVGTILTVSGVFVAALQICSIAWVRGEGDVFIWIATVIVAALCAGTPFMAYDSGIQSARRKERADAEHRRDMKLNYGNS